MMCTVGVPNIGQMQEEDWMRRIIVLIALLTIGALSIAAAVLSGLQTFLRYTDRATEHRRAAVSYDNIRRNFDLFVLEFKECSDRKAALAALRDLSAKLDAIGEAAPPIPQDIFDAMADAGKWRTTAEADYLTEKQHPTPPPGAN